MINQLIHNIYLAALYATLFASLFIIFRKNLVKHIGAQWSYYLWFVIFIPWVAVWLPLHFFPDIDNKLNLHVLTRPLAIQQDLHQVSFHSRVYLSNIIFIIWLSGALLYSLYILFKHFRFISLLKESTQLLTADQQVMVKNILAKNLIPIKRIYLSTAITSPMICHIFKAKIYLPANFFEYFKPIEQKYILQHECVHYHRCDLIANSAMLILICLNWFNPIISFSYRYFRCIQELSCDSILSYQMSSSEKKAYGYVLLKSALQPLSQTAAMAC